MLHSYLLLMCTWVITGKEMMKKWKALRDNFLRDHKKQRDTKSGQPAIKKKRYVFYEQLQFLIPYVGEGKQTVSNINAVAESIEHENPQESASNIKGNNEPKDLDEGEQSPKIRSPSRKRRCSKQMSRVDSILLNTTKNITQILSESVSLQREGKTDDKYGNKAFLLSFLPLMDSLPPHLCLDARMKITQVFQQVTAPTAPSTSYSFPNAEAHMSPNQYVVQSPLSVNTSLTDTSIEDLNISDYMVT